MGANQKSLGQVIIFIQAKFARAAVNLITVNLTARTRSSLKMLFAQASTLNGGERFHQLMDILISKIYSQLTGTHSDSSLLPQQNLQSAGGLSSVQWISN